MLWIRRSSVPATRFGFSSMAVKSDSPTNAKQTGGRTTTRLVDLGTMPIYVRAGAIIPFDGVRQYTSEVIRDPTTIKVYRGANGSYTLYDDDGISQDYLKGRATLTRMTWDDRGRRLTIEAGGSMREFNVELLPDGSRKHVRYIGVRTSVQY